VRLRFDFKADGWPDGALCFGDPVDVISANSIGEVTPALEAVWEASRRGLWTAGYVAYEAAPAFDPAFKTHAACDTPLVWFGIYQDPVLEPGGIEPPIHQNKEWRPAIDRAEYNASVAAIREAAGRGDLYQANYTFPLLGNIPDDAYAMYRNLQLSSLCGYGAFIDTGDLTIVSLSPELFFQFNHLDRKVTTRPMKGTRRRGRWLEEDQKAANTLAASEKDRAENLMIVDLLRNDIGRIAEHGTVHTPHLFEIERYPTVWQMTSTITGLARPDVSLPELFQALFPCGSVTGAPKIAAMQEIARLERSPRGVYCGAIGMVQPEGDALFSVAIRTITVDRSKHTSSYHVGGGITWDSREEDEYEEALSKASVLSEIDDAFELVETLRLERGEYQLCQRHIDRIVESAHFFGRPLARCDLEISLCNLSKSHPEGKWRVRLLANASGCVRAECMPLVSIEGTQRFCLSLVRFNSQDRFLFHKTTSRRMYAEAAEGHEDVYDVLLHNERGELTEFTRGNLVIETGDSRLTPRRECGLLAGTFRQELLAQGEISEHVITAEMLQRAERIWFINSVHGWVEMEQTPVQQVYSPISQSPL